jgi:hypothetical protein
MLGVYAVARLVVRLLGFGFFRLCWVWAIGVGSSRVSSFILAAGSPTLPFAVTRPVTIQEMSIVVALRDTIFVFGKFYGKGWQVSVCVP